MTSLRFIGKRAAGPMEKLLASAVAAATYSEPNLERSTLFVSSIQVDQGFAYKRMMPRARGRGAPIHKETCHITLTVGQGSGKRGKVKGERATAPVVGKKVK
jgi:large subunit ribosomal protein L22